MDVQILWASFRESFLTPARVVPLLITAAHAVAGLLVGYLAAHFPGLDLSEAQVYTLVIGVLGNGVATALHWQRGWQKYEERHAAGGGRLRVPGSVLEDPEGSDVHPDDAVPELDDLDSEKEKAAEDAELK